MKKKFGFLLAACVMASVALVGCGSDSDSDSKESATAKATQKADDKKDDKKDENKDENKDEKKDETADEQTDTTTDDQAEQASVVGAWKATLVMSSEDKAVTVDAYCEGTGADPSTFDVALELGEDGSAAMYKGGESQASTYEFDGQNVTVADPEGGDPQVLSFNANDAGNYLAMDMAGDGSLYLCFTQVGGATEGEDAEGEDAEGEEFVDEESVDEEAEYSEEGEEATE